MIIYPKSMGILNSYQYEWTVNGHSIKTVSTPKLIISDPQINKTRDLDFYKTLSVPNLYSVS